MPLSYMSPKTLSHWFWPGRLGNSPGVNIFRGCSYTERCPWVWPNEGGFWICKETLNWPSVCPLPTVSLWPCSKLVTCPECETTFFLWQLGSVQATPQKQECRRWQVLCIHLDGWICKDRNSGKSFNKYYVEWHGTQDMSMFLFRTSSWSWF